MGEFTWLNATGLSLSYRAESCNKCYDNSFAHSHSHTYT